MRIFSVLVWIRNLIWQKPYEVLTYMHVFISENHAKLLPPLRLKPIIISIVIKITKNVNTSLKSSDGSLNGNSQRPHSRFQSAACVPAFTCLRRHWVVPVSQTNSGYICQALPGIFVALVGKDTWLDVERHILLTSWRLRNIPKLLLQNLDHRSYHVLTRKLLVLEKDALPTETRIILLADIIDSRLLGCIIIGIIKNMLYLGELVWVAVTNKHR